MFETRKQLLKRIDDLEQELYNAAALPPCESLACINCEHIVIHKTIDGGVYPLGCGKNIACKDFKQKHEILSQQEKQSLLSEMLQQLQL